MTDIRLILSDIDGTILDDQHHVDSALAGTIAELKSCQIPFVLASARSPRGMQPIADALQLGDNPLACYNGALIVQGEQTLIEHQLNPKDIQELLTVLRQQFPQIAINLYSGSDWLVQKRDKWVEIEAAITGETPQLQDLAQVAGQVPTHKILLIAEPDVIQDFYALSKTLSFDDMAFYMSKDNYLEVTSQKVSKENALVEVAKFYEVPLEQTMTIGDNFNDLPMLKLAGLGVAMANAPAGVKAGADVETTANTDNGVSRAIQKYVLNKN